MTEWMQTYSGARFYPLEPRRTQYRIEDIAHALALVNRYNGHTPVPYSVAQHSVLVSRRVEELTNNTQLALWGLMHDASEAYICDVPRPLKKVMPEYRAIEARVMDAILEAFGLPLFEHDAIRRADGELLATEARDLMGITDKSWGLAHQPLRMKVEPLSWHGAEEAFLGRFHALVAPNHRPGFLFGSEQYGVSSA